nr:glycosyltransferase family 92 protein [Quercus suber]
MTWKLSLGVGIEERNGTSHHMTLITFQGHHPEVAALTSQEKGEWLHTYVADWQDRALGLGTRVVEPPNRSSWFCEVRDTGLKNENQPVRTKSEIVGLGHDVESAWRGLKVGLLAKLMRGWVDQSCQGSLHPLSFHAYDSNRSHLRFIHHPHRFVIVLTAATEAHAPSHRSSRTIADPSDNPPHPFIHHSTGAYLLFKRIGVTSLDIQDYLGD